MSLPQFIKDRINAYFEGKDAYTVCRNTLALAVLLHYSHKAAKKIHKDGFKKSVFQLLFAAVTKVPGAAGKIEEEKKKAMDQLEAKLRSEESKTDIKFPVLPKTGVPQETLLETLKKWKAVEDGHWKKGQVSGGIYHGGEDLLRFLVVVYGYFALSNPLHPDVFPYIRKMEAEVVSMTVNLFNGNARCCGMMTSGGTESILMAMKAYRDRAYEQGIDEPELITAVSAHAAFEKAAHYFRFKLVKVPVDPVTFKMDVAATARAINKNTMALVGSAPNFPQGVIDPIAELSDLAVKHKIGLHVDSCLGGFLLPFLSKIPGLAPPPFDFRLPGVSSISADTHKYGYAPKGTSVLMFNDSNLRQYSYFVAADWTGGIYASPSMPGSRAGGLIAAAWAAMVTMGESGYVECAKQIMAASKQIEAGIAEIKGLKVCGKPDMSVVAFTVDDSATGQKLNIYKISDAMKKRDWNLNTLQKPPAIHIACTYMHRDSAPKFVADLRSSVQEILEFPDKYKSGTAALYGMAGSLPDSSLTVELAKGFLDLLFKA